MILRASGETLMARDSLGINLHVLGSILHATRSPFSQSSTPSKVNIIQPCASDAVQAIPKYSSADPG